MIGRDGETGWVWWNDNLGTRAMLIKHGDEHNRWVRLISMTTTICAGCGDLVGNWGICNNSPLENRGCSGTAGGSVSCRIIQSGYSIIGVGYRLSFPMIQQSNPMIQAGYSIKRLLQYCKYCWHSRVNHRRRGHDRLLMSRPTYDQHPSSWGRPGY